MKNGKQTDLQGDRSNHAQDINTHTAQVSNATAEPANLWIPPWISWESIRSKIIAMPLLVLIAMSALTF